MRQEVTAESAELLARAQHEGEMIEHTRSVMTTHAHNRRQALQRLRMLGWSYGAIAHHLGCTRSAVQSILRSA